MWLAIRSAAFPAPNGVAGLLSLSSVSRTITFTPPAGRLAAEALTKLSVGPTPKTVDSSENTSLAGLKLMNDSLPTICRPGVVRALVPAKGSVLKVKVVAYAAGHNANSAAPMEQRVTNRI